MSVLCDLETFPASARHGVLCIGNFDGVHCGHARMLSNGRRIANEQGCPFAIMTFSTHPLSILVPASAPIPLTTLDQRLELLQTFSPDVIIVVKTSAEFLAVRAEAFLTEVVGRTIAARHWVEGPSFTFGRGAAGTIHTLQERSGPLGFTLHIIPTVQATLADLTQVDVSSSLIRWLISHGRMDDATRLLGHSYTLRSPVVAGAGRGKVLGFPTINLTTSQRIPAEGVYAGAAMVDHRQYPAAISVGSNPTFGQNQVSIEAFLLDFTEEIYGVSVDLIFYRWLRDQIAFTGILPLKKKIDADVQIVRAIYAQRNNISAATVVQQSLPNYSQYP